MKNESILNYDDSLIGEMFAESPFIQLMDNTEYLMNSARSNARQDKEEILTKELEMTKRMLERTVKLKNKYKSDLDICMNENKLLKIKLAVF